jgi:hypothetical protein
MDAEEEFLIDLRNFMLHITDYQSNDSFEISRLMMAIDILDNPNL